MVPGGGEQLRQFRLRRERQEVLKAAARRSSIDVDIRRRARVGWRGWKLLLDGRRVAGRELRHEVGDHPRESNDDGAHGELESDPWDGAPVDVRALHGWRGDAAQVEQREAEGRMHE